VSSTAIPTLILQQTNFVVKFQQAYCTTKGSKMKSLILKIHESPKKACLAITGGGTEAIGKLLRHGNGSATLLNAQVPYHPEAFNAYVKGKPDKYCSDGAARDLAMAAFQEATRLAPDANQNDLIGIGATASLVKPDGERDGREHCVYIAVQTATSTSTYVFYLHNNGYSRETEEELAADSIIKALGHACQVCDFPPTHQVLADPGVAEVVLGQRKVLSVDRANILTGHLPWKTNRIIFPGAFNPIHEQHANMAQKVSELTGQKVDLELCVRNVDKPALNYHEIEARVKNLKEQKFDWLEDIHLTATPTFAEKATWFPEATFLVGWDTFKRISDPKYGDLEKVIKTFKDKATLFLVFHRILNGVSSVDEGLDLIHPELLKLSKIYGPEVLQPVELSSSSIRKRVS
jgi:nicotinic acid mononucleotide adenylyltransferase